MKKLLFLLLLIPAIARADSASVGGNFRGLNNGDSSILIADNEAQDLLNVDLTKNGYGVTKRGGYAQFKTIGLSTWGVRGAYYFTDQSGNNKIIHANGNSVFYSLNGANYTAFYTTATAGSYWDFVDSQGILYGANHNHDPPFTYDGSALSFSTTAPKGSQVEAFPDRLVIAGSTSNPNNIYFSAAADFDNFGIGDITDTAPYFEYYGLPGQLVQAIKYHLGELLIWTKTSMGRYVGTNQFDGTIDDISNTIGSDQPSTVVTDLGVAYFQATDRHFYAYDGQSISKISDAIAGSVSGFVSGESKNAILTTQADFAAGSISLSGYLSTSYSAGDVLFATGTLVDEFSDGDYTANPAWTLVPGTATTWGFSGASLFIYRNGTPEGQDTLLYTAVSASTGSWSFVTNLTDNGVSQQSVKIELGVSTVTAVSTVSVTGQYSMVISSYAVEFNKNNVLVASTSLVSSYGTSYTFEMNRSSTSVWSIYRNQVLLFTATDSTYTGFNSLFVKKPKYALGTAVNYASYATRFMFYPGFATYQTPAQSIGTAITSWGTVDLNNVFNGGSIAYALYGDTDTSLTVSDSATWVSSQSIANNQIPTIATAAYVSLVASFSRTVSTQTPTLNDVTVNWFEGVTPRNWGTVDKDHRILWSVAEGTSTTPNATYIYDPRFQSWLKYSVPFDAPAKVGNSVYFGGVSTGVVYQWPTGNTDDGSAITAYWKSKDFIAPDPYIEKDFLSASIVAKAQAGSNLDVTYTINTTSSIPRNFSLTDSGGSLFKRINFYLPSGKYGTFINFKFGNDDSNSPFEFYSFKYDYKPRPWRVMQ